MSNFDSSPSCQIVIKMEFLFQFKCLKACVCLSTSSSRTAIWCCFHRNKESKESKGEKRHQRIANECSNCYSLSTKTVYSLCTEIIFARNILFITHDDNALTLFIQQNRTLFRVCQKSPSLHCCRLVNGRQAREKVKKTLVLCTTWMLRIFAFRTRSIIWWILAKKDHFWQCQRELKDFCTQKGFMTTKCCALSLI